MQDNLNSFGIKPKDKDSFSPWEAGLSTSEVINYGGCSGKVLLDSDLARQLISELHFLSQPVIRIVSDDNNRIQFSTA